MNDDERRQADEHVELEFSVSNRSYPFVGASSAEECRLELEEMIPRGDGRYAEFFSVSGTDPERILSLADDHDSLEPHLLEITDDGGLFEFSVSENCPAVALAERGALPRRVQGVDGDGRIVAELPARHDPVEVVETFLDEYPEAGFVAKRPRQSAGRRFGTEEFERTVRSHLTDRQREVLQVAYESGYYDWPRKCTGEEVAEELGISSATFSEHVHAAERKLLAVLFDRRPEQSESTEQS